MSLSFQKRQALMAKLQTRAKNLVPLYHRFILEEDKEGVRAWWYGAPDPNDYQTYDLYNEAFEEWMNDNINIFI